MPPVLPLFAYQQRWSDDACRVKICDKSRQIGISFVETLDIVRYLRAKKDRWYYLSISEDRSVEAIEYAIMHCLAMGEAAKLDDSMVSFEGVEYRRLRIKFPNGSQLIGLPANERTARGCSGNVTLDEFAHHIHAEQIWTAVFPVTTWGYRLHVISTPNGKQGKFYDLWTGNGKCDPEDIADGLAVGRDIVGDRWSRHLTTIAQAKEDGHPIDIEEARELAGDDLTWQQEYCGKFLDEALAWLPFSLIDAATRSEATLQFTRDTQRPAFPLYLGFDIGRKRDLSVVWLNERRPLQTVTRGLITMRHTEFDLQERQLNDLFPLVRRGCIDETGIGASLAEKMKKRWASRAEGVHFTAEVTAKMAANVKQRLERGDVWLPDCPEVRADLHSLRRTYTVAGNVRYEAPRTKDGHADRYNALGLALEAEDRAPIAPRIDTQQPYRMTRVSRDRSDYL